MPASQQALDAWVLATWTQAVGYAASLLRDRAEAEDVVHDCYCNLLRKADVYDLPTDGRKLLFKSVTNACIKRNTRRRPLLSLFVGDADDGGQRPLADPTAAEPAEIVITQELSAEIEAALNRLPVQQRAALQLKCLDQSLEEIGEALEVSPTHAGVLVHRARQALAVDLARYLKGKAQ
ncbi:MAG: sigma-70 family RNA polymerase sigma factor [Planctomycetia bacterium]|nr:sigma-70 family RNA polymerase sigma factor [Planctomycetia bacterium]